MPPRKTRIATVALLVGTRTASAQSHVACVGDSITAGIGTTSPQAPYPTVLQGLLGESYSVENDGVSGATMSKAGDLPYWTTAGFSAATKWATDAETRGDVVIQLGTNDSKPINWPGEAAFLGDCKALVEHFRGQLGGPRVWVSLVPPASGRRVCCTIDGLLIENEIVPALRTCAAETGASVIDVHGALAARLDTLVDGVHPNDEGAAIIAGVVHAALSKRPGVTLRAVNDDSRDPSEVTLIAEPQAAYGSVQRVDLYDSGTKCGTLGTGPWVLGLRGLAPGVHSFVAEMTETGGRTAVSQAATIVVSATVSTADTKPTCEGAAALDAEHDESEPVATTTTGGSAASRDAAAPLDSGGPRGCSFTAAGHEESRSPLRASVFASLAVLAISARRRGRPNRGRGRSS